MSATLIDRVVRWNLDPDGDLYGDERERLRWYEGIAAAAGLQWIALPWAAAALVLALGAPAVLPTSVMLVLLLVPMALCTTYVRRRHVDTLPRSFSRKRVVVSVLSGLPWVVYTLGALHALAPGSNAVVGGLVGGLLGASVALGVLGLRMRSRREQEAVAPGDEA